MKEFFLILFFGKSVLLTPMPVTLEDEVALVPKEPLSAITIGANLEIDVTHIIKWAQEEEGILEFRDRVRKRFPPQSIKARLIQKTGNEITLSYDGLMQFNNKSTLLSLYGEKGVPIDREFYKVIITSNIKINDVLVHWKNHTY